MKINYKEKIVLFVDVLGFSNLVFNEDSSKIQDYFSYVNAEFHAHLKKRRFNYLIFSDSLVISADKSNENLSELIFLVGKIQYELFIKGILIRGAISLGNLYINKTKNIIVGPGLINAYNLENVAKYPRIIIDRKIIPEFSKSSQQFIDSMKSEKFYRLFGEEDRLKFDENLNDGYPYINFLKPVTRYGSTYLRKNLNNIIKLFKSNYYSNKHYEKYDWLLRNFIVELKLAKEHYEEHSDMQRSKKRVESIKSLLKELESL